MRKIFKYTEYVTERVITDLNYFREITDEDRKTLSSKDTLVETATKEEFWVVNNIDGDNFLISNDFRVTERPMTHEINFDDLKSEFQIEDAQLFKRFVPRKN